MPWPGGPTGMGRCHYWDCTKGGFAVAINCGDGRRVDRLVCPEHRELLEEAAALGLALEVTTISPLEEKSFQGGTIWINTIRDFWYGKRKAI